MIIYALIDPRDYTTRYIGITKDLYKAFIEHLRGSTKDARTNIWIEDLRRLHLVPILKTLEVIADPETANKREVYWIQHYRYLGQNLLNAALPASKVKQEAFLEMEPQEDTKLLGLTYIQAARLPACRQRGIKTNDVRHAVKRGAIRPKSDGSISKNSVLAWLRSLD
jgi:hypothetical protein